MICNRTTLRVLVAAVAILIASETGHAQSTDTARYTVSIVPYMELTALTADRTANHTLSGGNIVFTNNQWFARTSSSTGSTIRWTTDHSFWNMSDNSYRRDARLRLTRLVGSATSGWQLDTIQDQTNTAAGDETAAVQVSSRRPGNSITWMEVTFITGNVPTLRGGVYEMTVVGTISAN